MLRLSSIARKFLVVVVVSSVSLALVSVAEEPADQKPNVIVIFTDDHGYSDFACQGIQSDLKTPNIDAIASGGARMTSGYVTAPQCVPSRAGLLSGRSQNRFGVESNGMSLAGFDAQETIAERVKKLGYATGMTGKWHLGPANDITSHGFDDVYFKNANRPGWANYDLDGSTREGGVENSKLYHLDANSEAACAFIRRHKSEPFFFYCAYRAPHVPLDAPPKYLKRFDGEMPERRRQALAMISAIDDGVGKIMSTLREHKLEERTLLFIIGDNGAPLKIHKLDAPGGGPGWDGSLNEPLNGEKGMLSEGGIRVPFLVYWKGTIPGGQTYDHPVISLDVAATTIALAGGKQDAQLDGVNIVPHLQGKIDTAPHETLYWRWIAQSAVREGKWKYLRGGEREYLFDLSQDVEEQHNVIHRNRDIAVALRDKLTAWADDLQPAGLATGAMSSTWEDYYDFYLDGKPAPEPREKFSPDRKGKGKGKGEENGLTKNGLTKLHGWLARGGQMIQDAGFTRIEPAQSNRGRIFIAASGLKLAGKLTAVVRLKTKNAGKVGFHWRENGQSDFVESCKSLLDTNPSSELKTLRIELPSEREIIHLRLILPVAGADLASIQMQDASGETVRAWEFGM